MRCQAAAWVFNLSVLYVSAVESLCPGVGLFMHTDALLSSFKYCISVASSLGVPATGIQCVWQMERWCMWGFFFSVFMSVPIWFLPTPNLANPIYPRNGIWVFWRCTKESRQAWTYKVITERGRSCLESISSFGIHLIMANFSCPKSSPKTWFISVEGSQHWPGPARLLLQTLNGRF